MATRYMNRFAIEEDDQFEIHICQYKDTTFIREDKICKTIEQLIKKAEKGSYDINLRYMTYRLLLTIVLIHSNY